MADPGEHCTDQMQCADGATCAGFDPGDPNAGHCVKLGAEGDACPCGRSLTCVEGKCAAYGAGVCGG